ncbi:MAG TPA: cellulase N-terminal Ig-like domain-containing protein, partial [Pyrinomonadaceae bacterium]|nr:cellulase N-terminal Ig-like domain-containing protein [Pyrinomonadaceae bacterium]
MNRFGFSKVIFLVIACCFGVAAEPTSLIKVDQVGYLPDARKLAFVVTNQNVSEFFIRSIDGNSLAFRGTLSARVDDIDSGDQVQVADFSALETQGTFYLEVPGLGRSWTFGIGPLIYQRAFYLALRAFYGQRCGTAVNLGPDFPNYKHAACHLT